MKPTIKIVRFAAIIAALASLAFTQEGRIYREGGNWVQEISGDLGTAKNLRVKFTAADIHLQGGSQASVTYVIHRKAHTSSEDDARRQFASDKIVASVKGDTAAIVAESGERDHKYSDDLVVNVPRNLEFAKLETGGGSLSVARIAGRVELTSGGGSLHLEEIGGAVSAQTGGGSIEAGNVGGDTNLETGGGSIKIGAVQGEVRAESGGGSLVVASSLRGATLQTGGGSIKVGKCGGPVKATTGGGVVDLGEVGGPAEIETGAGSIRVDSAQGRVQARTGGGSIHLDGATSVSAETSAGGISVKLLPDSHAEHSDSKLETSAGDITVYLANNVAMSVRAEVEMGRGHSIQSDFQEIRVSSEGSEYGPKTFTAEGQLNGGGPVLKVRTNSGTVNFRRVSQ